MTSRHLLHFKKTILIVFVVLFSAIGIQSSNAKYYPSGIQQNISERTLRDNGWKLFYEQTYSTLISSLGSELIPSGRFIIVTGKSIGSNMLTTVAAAPTNSVFTETDTNTPQLLNGTYWYYTPGTSFGYSPTNVINQASADITGCNLVTDSCASDPSRLSWHLGGVVGGFRLGTAGWINENISGGDLYLKQVWTWDGVPTQALRQTSNLSFDQSQHGSDTLSDPDGQLRKTLNSINAKYGNLLR
jgi:hypothetical protein